MLHPKSYGLNPYIEWYIRSGSTLPACEMTFEASFFKINFVVSRPFRTSTID